MTEIRKGEGRRKVRKRDPRVNLPLPMVWSRMGTKMRVVEDIEELVEDQGRESRRKTRRRPSFLSVDLKGCEDQPFK